MGSQRATRHATVLMNNAHVLLRVAGVLLHLTFPLVLLNPLLSLLLLNSDGIRLHADRNDKSSEGVTTHNATIIHDILRSNFNVFTVGISVLSTIGLAGIRTSPVDEAGSSGEILLRSRLSHHHLSVSNLL